MQLFFGIEREPPRLRPPGLAWDWIFSSVVELKKDIVWRSTRRINCNFYMYLEFAYCQAVMIQQRLRLEMKFCFCYSFCGFLYTLATCPGGKTGGLHIFIPLHFLQGEKVENYCLNEWPYDVIEIWNVHRKEKENKASGNSYQALCTLMMPISLKDDWFVRTQCRSQYQIRIIRGDSPTSKEGKGNHHFLGFGNGWYLGHDLSSYYIWSLSSGGNFFWRWEVAKSMVVQAKAWKCIEASSRDLVAT